jgi:hypothetical protein
MTTGTQDGHEQDGHEQDSQEPPPQPAKRARTIKKTLREGAPAPTTRTAHAGPPLAGSSRNHVLALDRFPVRPRAQPGESTLGFLVRLCGANGHMLPDWVVPQLSNAADQGASTQSWLHLGLPSSRAAPSESNGAGTLVWSPGAYRPFEAGLRAKKTWWGPLVTSPRVCPACITHERLHRALWEIPLVQVCPEHRLPLQGRCTKCRGALNWNDLLAWTCTCGQPLQDLEPETNSCSPAQWRTAQVFAAAVQLRLSGPGVQGEPSLEPSGEASKDASYLVEDIVDALAFGHALREELRRLPPKPRIGNFFESRWRVKRGKVVRHAPGWWEARWLAYSDAQRDRLTRRLLLWNFRYRAGWLVFGLKDEGLARVQDALAAAPMSACLNLVRESLARTLRACESPVRPGQALYFNSRLMHADGANVREGLHRTWPAMAEEIARSPLVPQPGSLVEAMRMLHEPRLHRGTFRRLVRELALPDGLRPKHLCEILGYHGVPRWTSCTFETTCQRPDCSAAYCWFDHHVTETNQNMPTSYVYRQPTR